MTTIASARAGESLAQRAAKLQAELEEVKQIPQEEFLRMYQSARLQNVPMALAPKGPTVHPTLLFEQDRGAPRHRGITILFSDTEHAMLHLVSLARDRSYSHTLRSLLFEEAARIWPQGITADRWREARKTKEGEGERRKAEAEEYAARLRKKAEEALEKQLLAEEAARRLGKMKGRAPLEVAYERAILDRERKLRRKLSEHEAEEVRVRVRVKRGVGEDT